jgi:excisionase family DNA binding protein
MKRLITADEAGALLSVPSSWVLREARAGRVPHVRLGRYVRFDAEALDAWWRARAQGPQRGVPGSEPGSRRNGSA